MAKPPILATATDKRAKSKGLGLHIGAMVDFLNHRLPGYKADNSATGGLVFNNQYRIYDKEKQRYVGNMAIFGDCVRVEGYMTSDRTYVPYSDPDFFEKLTDLINGWS